MTGITALRGFFNACLGVEARTSKHVRRPRPGSGGAGCAPPARHVII